MRVKYPYRNAYRHFSPGEALEFYDSFYLSLFSVIF